MHRVSVYGVRVTVDGVDRTAAVESLSITRGRESFAAELSLSLADPELLTGWDWSRLDPEPRVEVDLLDGETWKRQGAFFIERPSRSDAPGESRAGGLWGRSRAAKLARPFAGTLSARWSVDRLASEIAAEIVGPYGVPLSWEIEDFTVPAYTYEVDGQTPMEALQSLAELAGAAVTTDVQDRARVVAVDYAGLIPTATIEDVDLESLGESIEVPEYGNRVRVEPRSISSGYTVEIVAPEACLPNADGEIEIYAVVTDGEGRPVNGLVVAWTLDGDGVEVVGSASGNTGRLDRYVETLQASRHYLFTTTMPPAALLSVVPLYGGEPADPAAAVIEGREVALGAPLRFCDSTARLAYAVDGVAVLRLRPLVGASAGAVTVTAACSGAEATAEVRVASPCDCPVEVELNMAETILKPGEGASCMALARQGGQPRPGAVVYMGIVEGGEFASLRWASASMDNVRTSERVQARRSGDRVVVDLRHAPEVVESAYRVHGEAVIEESVLDGHAGQVVTLKPGVPVGATVEVAYWASGAWANHVTISPSAPDGARVRVRAWASSAMERPQEVFAEITVRKDADAYRSDEAPPLEPVNTFEFGADEDPYEPEGDADPQGQVHTEITCSPDGYLPCPDENACGNVEVKLPLSGTRICVQDGPTADLGDFFTTVRDAAGVVHIALRANALFTDGSRVGPVRMAYDANGEAFAAAEPLFSGLRLKTKPGPSGQARAFGAFLEEEVP